MGFCDKIVGALCSMCCGFILFPLCGVMVWYNEANSVCTAKAYSDGKDQIIEANCENNPANGDKFVHFDCPVTKAGVALGPWQSSGGFWLAAKTEMLQYVEQSHSESSDDRRLSEVSAVLDGSNTSQVFEDSSDPHSEDVSGRRLSGRRRSGSSTTCYTWHLEWSPRAETFNTNNRPCHGAQLPTVAQNPLFAGHTPTTGVGQYNSYSDAVELGPGWTVLNKQLSAVNSNDHAVTSTGYEFRVADATALVGWKEDVALKGVYRQCSEPTCAHLGSKKIAVDVYGTKRMSGVGAQATNSGRASVTPFQAGGSTTPPCDVRNLLEIYGGSASSSKIFKDWAYTLGFMTILLRIVSFCGFWFSLCLMTQPIATAPQVFEIIPGIGDYMSDCIGGLVGCLLCCFTFFIGSTCWLLTTACAWIFYRPLIGFGLLLVSVVCCGAAYYLKTNFGKTRGSGSNSLLCDRPRELECVS